MKKSPLVYGLGALCIILVGICVLQQHQICCLKSGACGRSERMPACKSDTAKTMIPCAEKDVKTPAETEQVVSVVVSQNSEASTPSATTAEEWVEESVEEQGMEKFFEGVSEMMKSPEMKDAIQMQQRAAIQITYKDLISYLELSAEDRAAFEALLLEKQMASMDGGLKMMDSSLNPEDRSATAEQLKQLTNRYDERIKTFLGDEDYAVYEEFERTQPERIQVNQYKQALAGENALSDDQENELILMMHETRTNFQYSVNMKQIESNPSALTEESVELLLEDMMRMEQQYLLSAEEILDDSQYQAYESSLRQQRTMQEAGMKMALKMFRGAGQEQ